MNIETVRLNALKLAAEGSSEPPEAIVARAEAYLKFLTADSLRLPRNFPDKTQGGNVRQASSHKSIRDLAARQLANGERAPSDGSEDS